MSVLENLSIAKNKSEGFGMSRGVDKKNIPTFKEGLAAFNMGLEDRLSAKSGELSGGQRQAMALYMATICHPRLLLLDEHTAALDPASSKAVMDKTSELLLREDLTAIMVTHNMRHALEVGDRLIALSQGKVILDVKGEEKQNLAREDIEKNF
jgi:putative ABC transport system ATP-binding protein